MTQLKVILKNKFVICWNFISFSYIYLLRHAITSSRKSCICDILVGGHMFTKYALFLYFVSCH